jgi:uncharacterized delta-60 repeat protein
MAVALVEALERRRMLSYGRLDPAFGSVGVATATPAVTNQRSVQTFGQVGSDWIIGGPGTIDDGSFNPRFTYQLARFDSLGTLVNSYGAHGVASLSIDGFPDATAVAADGSIALGGEVSAGGTAQGQGVSITKITPAGAVDTTFGTGGTATILHRPNQADPTVFVRQIGRLGWQPDGKLIVAAFERNDLVIFRLLPDGTLDSGFGAGGVTRFVNVSFSDVNPATVSNVIVRPDGRIYIAAGQIFNDPFVDEDGIVESYAPISQGIVTRLHADGTIDHRFGPGAPRGGRIFTKRPAALSIAPDGTLLLVETEQLADSNGEYANVGTFIESYTASGGHARRLGGHSWTQLDFERADALVTEVTQLSDGSYVLAVNRDSGAAIGRLGANAVIDRSFGSHGLLTITPGDAAGMRVLSDDAVLLGFSQPQSAGQTPALNLARVRLNQLNPNAIDDAPHAAVTRSSDFRVDIAGTDGDDVISVTAVDEFTLVVKINGKQVDDPEFNGAYRQIEIHGDGGNDRITVSRGLEQLVVRGDDGNDTIVCDSVLATVYGDAGDDRIRSAGVLLVGGSGYDRLQADGSGATIMGGSGRDTLIANGSDDVLYPQSGRDIIFNQSDRPGVIFGADDLDTIFGASGPKRLSVISASPRSILLSIIGVPHDQGARRRPSLLARL